MKLPKPMGRGNYSICESCRGIGATITIKAARSRKILDMKQSDQMQKCKACKGVGWVDAER